MMSFPKNDTTYVTLLIQNAFEATNAEIARCFADFFVPLKDPQTIAQAEASSAQTMLNNPEPSHHIVMFQNKKENFLVYTIKTEIKTEIQTEIQCSLFAVKDWDAQKDNSDAIHSRLNFQTPEKTTHIPQPPLSQSTFQSNLQRSFKKNNSRNAQENHGPFHNSFNKIDNNLSDDVLKENSFEKYSDFLHQNNLKIAEKLCDFQNIASFNDYIHDQNSDEDSLSLHVQRFKMLFLMMMKRRIYIELLSCLKDNDIQRAQHLATQNESILRTRRSMTYSLPGDSGVQRMRAFLGMVGAMVCGFFSETIKFFIAQHQSVIKTIGLSVCFWCILSAFAAMPPAWCSIALLLFVPIALSYVKQIWNQMKHITLNHLKITSYSCTENSMWLRSKGGHVHRTIKELKKASYCCGCPNNTDPAYDAPVQPYRAIPSPWTTSHTFFRYLLQPFVGLWSSPSNLLEIKEAVVATTDGSCCAANTTTANTGCC